MTHINVELRAIFEKCFLNKSDPVLRSIDAIKAQCAIGKKQIHEINVFVYQLENTIQLTVH